MKRTFVEVSGICPPPVREEGGPKLRHTPRPHLVSCSLRPPAPPYLRGWAWPGPVCGVQGHQGIVLNCLNLFDSTSPVLTHFTRLLKELFLDPKVRQPLHERQGSAVVSTLTRKSRHLDSKVLPWPRSKSFTSGRMTSSGPF